ncbi:ureidoglycolate dehydrogenase AllD, partial [Salmonella enterica subsp. enterica serovar Abony]
DKNGAPTHDPFAVNALLPAAGPKGYGLMMMIDILSGILLGLPFGRQVSSMYEDLHAGRNLGQLHLVINPAFFSSCELFRKHISQTMQELNAVKPAPGFKQVYYPGQDQDIKQKNADMNGIDIVDDIYQYLISGALYLKSYETKNPFAQ